MTGTAWALNTPTYNGKQLRQTTLAPLLAGATSARPLGARSGVRLGTPSTTVTATSTTWTVHPHAGAMDKQSSAVAAPYGYAFDQDQTGTIAAANATYPRTDLISVIINDTVEDGSLLENCDIVYTQGTAAVGAPVPATPARCMTIAQINVPVSGGGSPSVTWVAPPLVAAGGITPSTAAAFGSGTYVGQYIDDPTKGLLRWTGTAWATQSDEFVGSEPTVNGTPPPASKPMITRAGHVTTTITNSTGGFSFNYNAPFPTAVVSIVASGGYPGGVAQIITDPAYCTTSAVGGSAYYANGSYVGSGATIVINYIAVGY